MYSNSLKLGTTYVLYYIMKLKKNNKTKPNKSNNPISYIYLRIGILRVV